MANLEALHEDIQKKQHKQEKIDYKKVDFKREGKTIIIPPGMGYDELKKWADLHKLEENRFVAVTEFVECFPLDGAVAFTKALSEEFGWVDYVPTPGFFGEEPPQMISVEVAPGKMVQVPWSRFKIPGVDGWVASGVHRKDGKSVFVINGEVKNKHKQAVQTLADTTRRIVREESIYRGQAIRVKFPEPPKTGRALSFAEEMALWDPTQNVPKFMSLKGVNPKELIFPKDLERMVGSYVFGPIEKTEECRLLEIPLKRGILLEGPFGCGKTLTAKVTAKKCVEQGWTFIYLDNVRQLKEAINFGQQYSPAVIFAEDIDSAIGEQRDEFVNDILNIIDGVEYKNAEVMVVLTTNSVEKIHQAMLRPGRLDTVISIRQPDADAVERLIRLYGRTLIPPGENLRSIGLKLGDKVIPATVREVVERAKLDALYRGLTGEKMELRAVDLDGAAESMLQHLKLLEPKAKNYVNPFTLFGEAFGKEVGKMLQEASDGFVALLHAAQEADGAPVLPVVNGQKQLPQKKA